MCYSPASITALVLNGGAASPPPASRPATAAMPSFNRPAPWSVPVLAVAIHARAASGRRHVTTTGPADTGGTLPAHGRRDERLPSC